MNKNLKRRGSMLLTVMILLIVVAIIAMKLMPDEQTQVIRENETFYDSDLSQLREAIDLARLAAKNPNSKLALRGWTNFCATDTSASITEKIELLYECGYLRKPDLKDASVPDFQWGTNSTELYWKVSTNYASNSSFEIVASEDYEISASWNGVNASASVENHVKLNSMSLDEYPFQNKLGDSTKGENEITMIKIIKEPIPSP